MSTLDRGVAIRDSLTQSVNAGGNIGNIFRNHVLLYPGHLACISFLKTGACHWPHFDSKYVRFFANSSS